MRPGGPPTRLPDPAAANILPVRLGKEGCPISVCQQIPALRMICQAAARMRSDTNTITAG
ncbi:MAG: hypothetical protein AVDCRST_MAG70-758 [uncultured Thermomicrobiales bacterium]|uniref:Uncharacterized protein n=1 Tax=uncultured Thermomicrobiales bacterium TaxID=1645740 RepID=A0A6J4UGE7_9BACT|nr:MAG: hypothetical protein AVDCRST_MAG70-758 [uncultured Thermomicrobiales bacterium]